MRNLADIVIVEIVFGWALANYDWRMGSRCSKMHCSAITRGNTTTHSESNGALFARDDIPNVVVTSTHVTHVLLM